MSVLPASLIEELRRLHAGPQRGYHGWDHPQALLGLLVEGRAALHDPLAVECAILFHDAIYDPTRTDNERNSAAPEREKLTGRMPGDCVGRAVRLIEATERHEVADGLPAAEADDCWLFLDMDLSVLGADEAAFDRYEAGVRHEIATCPSPISGGRARRFSSACWPGTGSTCQHGVALASRKRRGAT